MEKVYEITVAVSGIGLGCLPSKGVLPVISLLPDNAIVYE